MDLNHNKQRLFDRYSYLFFIDLTVLNLFNEFWDRVFIESFSISLLVTLLLQISLQITLHFEHKATQGYKSQKGLSARIKRILTTWCIVLISKFIILWSITQLFGEAVHFAGPNHGILAFIIVVFAILFAEQGVLAFRDYLGKDKSKQA